MTVPHQSSLQLDLAVATLRGGGIVAHATEGVWGLACDPFDEAAVQRVLALKSRPVGKGLILLAASAEQVLGLLQPLDEAGRERLEAPTDGPVTWLVPCRLEVPRLLRGDHTTLAVRITSHPQSRELLRRLAGPVVSTSANPAGRPPARTALRVRQYFGNAVDFLLPGSLGGATGPSEIRHLRDGRILRGAP